MSFLVAVGFRLWRPVSITLESIFGLTCRAWLLVAGVLWVADYCAMYIEKFSWRNVWCKQWNRAHRLEVHFNVTLLLWDHIINEVEPKLYPVIYNWSSYWLLHRCYIFGWNVHSCKYSGDWVQKSWHFRIKHKTQYF